MLFEIFLTSKSQIIDYQEKNRVQQGKISLVCENSPPVRPVEVGVFPLNRPSAICGGGAVQCGARVKKTDATQ